MSTASLAASETPRPTGADSLAIGVPLPGQRLGKLEILSTIAAGSFGTVFEARDLELDRIVAVKIPSRNVFASTDQEQAFLREAQNVSRLNHRGIVPVYELGRHQGFIFIVMERVYGESLAQVLATRHFTPREAAEMARQLADALDHAHAAGVVHRDLKPANIMLDQRGYPRILDFGLGKRIDVETSRDSEGMMIGTLAYMPPEQARGQSYLTSGRSDVYSLGVILFQLLTGETPFRGQPYAVIEQILADDPPSPRKLNNTVPRDLETLTLKCLEKDPLRRFATAGELAAELQRFLEGRPIRSRPIGPLARAGRWCRRNPGPVTSAAIVSAILVGALVLVTSAWQAAKRAQQQTLAHLSSARDAVDTWYTFQGQLLQDDPAAHAELLRKAREDYDAFVRQSSADPGLEIERGRCYVRLSRVYRELLQHEEARQALSSAEALFLALLRDRPDDEECRFGLAQCRAELASLLAARRQDTPAETPFRQATDSLEQLAAERQQEPKYREALATVLHNRAAWLAQRGHPDQAVPLLRRATRDLAGLREAYPQDTRYLTAMASARNLLGGLLRDQGHVTEAAEEIGQTLRALEIPSATKEVVEARAGSHVFLASVRRAQGRTADELAAYRHAVRDYQQVVAQFQPGELLEKLGIAHADLGQLLSELGQCRNAQPELEAAVDVFARLATSTATPRCHEELAVGLDNLAQVLADLGANAEAQQNAEQAVAILADLARLSPASPRLQQREAVSRSHWARVLQKLQRQEEATAQFRQALAIMDRLLATTPTSETFQETAVFILQYQGELSSATDQPQLADESFRRCRELWEALAANPHSPRYRQQFAKFLANCPDPQHRDVTRATELAHQAVQQVPDNAEYWSTLGLALYRAGKYQESQDALQQAGKLKPPIAPDLFVATLNAFMLGQPDEARRRFAEAQAWMQENRPDHPELASLADEARRALAPPVSDAGQP